MSFSFDCLRRWSCAYPGSRWAVTLALAFAVLLGTTLGVHEDIHDATVELADVIDVEPASKAKAVAKSAQASADKRGAAGDKLEVPQGVFAHAPPLQLARADSEPPVEPVSRRPVLPQPERLLRPPNA